MKLLDTILLSLATGFFIIGVHQLITVGLAQAYWVFMLSTVLLIWYQIRKKSQKAHLQNLNNNPKSKKSARKRAH
jgi:4-hydroxybenzoate polyprenyltransferase